MAILKIDQVDWSRLVTNRTSRDVERWRELRDKGWAGMTSEERQEWMGEVPGTTLATRGMYTHVDLNRVESHVEVLASQLRSMGLLHEELSVKTDWTYEHYFWKNDMVRYLGNIDKLRACVTVKWDTPATPSINDKFDYEAANKVEKILFDIADVTLKLIHAKYYVGELISGEV